MVAEFIQHITTWLHNHPHIAVIFAGLVAFLESLAIVGSIVPGSVTLTAIGVLIGSGIIPVTETFIAAIIGAILGDLLSYAVGHYYQESLRNRWPFRNYPNMIYRGEQFFYKHGGKSIAIGRFFGPIRAVLPLVAGMLNMPFYRFLIADIISGIFWAPAYMLPGVLLGAATLELAPEQATWLMLWVLGILVVLWLIIWLLKHFWYLLTYYIDKASLRAWLFMRRHNSFILLTKLLENSKRGRQHMQLVRLIGSITCILMLTMLSFNVAHKGLLTSWNEPIHYFFQNIRFETLDEFMVAVTILGDKQFIATFVTILAVIFLYYRQTSLTVYWIVNAAIVTLAAYLLKNGIANPRPIGVMVVRASSSFPSFHTAFATAVYSFLSLLVIQRRGATWRKMISLLLVSLLLLIGLSRIYLGAHWFTDVIAGYLLGMSCGMTVLMIYFRCPFHEPKEIMHLWWVYAFSITTSYLAVAYHLYPIELQHNAPYYPRYKLSVDEWWQQEKPLLPMYRRFRDGTPAVLFNIQWMGHIKQIENHLISHKWTIVNKPTLITAMSRLMAKDKTRTLPVLEPLFQAQYPELTMTKSLGPDKPLVVLRLWHANYQMKDTHPDLWLGTIHYRLLWQHRWLPQYEKYLPSLPAADGVLLSDIADYQINIIQVKVDAPLHYSNTRNNHHIILIKR